MERSVADDLHATRVLLSEQHVVDTQRLGLAKRFVMRGSRMFTHRLVAANGHLADAVQLVDDGQRAARAEARTARDETRQVRESVDALAGEDRARADAHEVSVTELLRAANASIAALEAAVRSLQSRLAVAEHAAAHQRSELQRARTQLGRLSRGVDAEHVGAEGVGAEPASTVEWSADALDEQGYLDFEERFRGSRDEIRARQRDAVQYLSGLQPGRGPLLDMACGRGEWLDVLGSEGIDAYGVDSNAAMISEAAAAGLDVRCEDALVHLAKVEESSLQGISAFHFVEHIPLGVLVKMLDDALLALRPGGILLFETPNPTNLMVGSASFYLDPTHVRPIHPEFLRFLVESRGFVDVQIHYVHPAIPAETMIASGPTEGYPDARLDRVVHAVEGFVYGPQDYVLTARRADVAEPETLVVPTEG
jgi:SAM-dependent methyltransferase